MMSQVAIVEWLLTLPRANVNVQDSQGMTGLHWACAEDISLARILLQAGASPDIQDEEGNTSLHIAASYGHIGFTQEMAALSEHALYIENQVRRATCTGAPFSLDSRRESLPLSCWENQFSAR